MYFIEASPYADSMDLLAYATETAIMIVRMEKTKSGRLNFTPITEYSIGSRPTALSWSPEAKSHANDGVYQTDIWYGTLI